jgi:hypothetical protein
MGLDRTLLSELLLNALTDAQGSEPSGEVLERIEALAEALADAIDTYVRGAEVSGSADPLTGEVTGVLS